MHLIPVGTSPTDALLLYQLLIERHPCQSISHKQIPTLAEHLNFIASQPYLSWNIIQIESTPVGAIYLSHKREIGIGILEKHQRNGYAKQAIELLMALRPGKFLANINPANEASIALFKGFGFHHIQNTYSL